MKESRDKVHHSEGTKRRKTVAVQIQKEMNELLSDVGADRVVLFEYSNGSTNFGGLPFCFVTAAHESLSLNTLGTAPKLQRVNLSLFATFLEHLEKESYFYEKEINNVKHTYPVFYAFFEPYNKKSVLCYIIEGLGDKDTLGFIMVTSNEKTFTRKDALPKVAKTAQRLSSYLNFEETQNIANGK